MVSHTQLGTPSFCSSRYLSQFLQRIIGNLSLLKKNHVFIYSVPLPRDTSEGGWGAGGGGGRGKEMAEGGV